MTRKAILIGTSNVWPPLPGVDIDLRDIKNFLLSTTGGAWEDSEIITLRNSNRTSILAIIALCEEIDYVLITCSGHGDHYSWNGGSDTALLLSEKEKIFTAELNTKNPRQLVVMDVCRKIEELPLSEGLLGAANAVFIKRALSREYARTLFNKSLDRTTEGRIVMYSCSINQTAADDGTGGLFTQSLIKSAFQSKGTPVSFYDGYEGNILYANEAFEFAKARTLEFNPPQTAILNAGRRRDSYPFAIV
jgi:hypothetical protein